MAINVGDNFNYQGKKYLDNRQSFKTLSELQAYTNVPEGFIAYCEEDKKRYEYIDGSWREYVIDSSGGGETIDTSNFATKDELNTKFDDVLVNEEDSTDGQTALDFFANGEKVKTVYFSGGGSGGAAAYISTTLPEEAMVETGYDFDILLDFYSPNPGKGTLKVFVNDVDALSTPILQGETTTTLSHEKLTKGTNKIVVYVLDRIGTMSNSLTFYVRYGSTELVGEFDSSLAYDYGANIRYYFTATALDTSLALTFYMSIDGAVQNGVSCVSDVRGYFTFPNSLEAGGHYCECWVEDSKGGKSNIETFNLVILDTNTLAIVTETRNPSVEEGSQLVLDYRVYKKNETTFIIKTYVDEELVSTGTCGLTTSYYKTTTLREGMHNIKIEAWDMTETVSDYITWSVIITPSTYTMLEPIKAGSMFMATAKNRTNGDPNRETWTGYNQDNNAIDCTLYNFAFNSESGWMDDQLFITGNSYVEVPLQPLANNARYGFTLDVEFSTKPIGVDDAEVLSLWNDTDNCGIKITTDQLILQSKTGNKCELYFSENEIVSAIFIIDRHEKTAKVYLNGVMCAAFALSDYTAEGVSYLEDFTVNDNLYLGKPGSNGYATIKNLRIYELALSSSEILNNFMANEIDKAKQKALVEFQKGEDLPTVTVYCDFSGLGKNDKKYCDIVYNSPDPVKYGESFSLMGKYSQLQYQGTSSMQYPIKNYRLNPKDANGKVKIKLPNCQPETRFTLKADFMSSGHWQNTGLTKWINDNLYNYKEDDPKTMNPAKWWAIQNGKDPNDYRECIYGFPCRLILVNDGNSPLNEGQQEPTPGNTKDMGIFNFNLDKDCENSLGFKIKDFPNALSMEVTANSDTSAGAFMSFTKDKYNIGSTREAFSTLIPLDVFGGARTLSMDSISATGLLVEYNATGANVTYGTTINQGDMITLKDSTTKIRFSNATFKDAGEMTISGITFFYTLGVVQELNKDEPKYCIPAVVDGSDELDYIKESFELRYPDEDDVPEGWGFMYGESPQKTVDYRIQDNQWGTYLCTTRIPREYFGTGWGVYINSPGLTNIVLYNEAGNNRIIEASDGDTRIDEYPYVILRYSDLSLTSLTINGEVYHLGEETTDSKLVKEPYMGYHKDTSYGLKALIDWVDNSTDEQFVAEFEDHFHKDYTLRYFLLVMVLGMVDNLGKNMMLDSYDGKIWMPRFYDCDTICSYDNSGAIKFDVDIEMQQGYWNTSSSRLWTRVRDLFHDELVVKYNDMRQNGMSYESFMNVFYNEQIAKIPQKYYNQDADVKYLPYADEYLGKAHGDGYEHLKRWLKNRIIFTDSLYDYAPSYTNDMITFRANTTEEMTITIETYTPVYQHVSWYNGNMQKEKIAKGTQLTFKGFAQAATDQEVLVYGGSNIKRIIGISTMNPNSMLIGNATRLVELDISDCPILTDINSNKANFTPHTYLNKLDISNCPQLGGSLRLNYSPLIGEINAMNTAITDLQLPSSIRNLHTLKVPGALTNLTLNDGPVLSTLEFDGPNNLQSVNLTNCNALTNIVNFDMTQIPAVTLNNSYDADELYMSKTTNLSLVNMANVKKLIFVPNNEHETFNLTELRNCPDYTISAVNCPSLKTFMTTAENRLSYKHDSSVKSLPYIPVEYIESDGSQYFITDYYANPKTKFVADAELTVYVEYMYVCGGERFKFHFMTPERGFLYIENCTISPQPTTDIYQTRQRWTATSTLTADDPTPLHILCGYGKSGLETNLCGKAKIYGIKIYEDDMLVKDYMPCVNRTNRIACLYDLVNEEFLYPETGVMKSPEVVVKETAFCANTLDISNTKITDVNFLCTTDVYQLKLPDTVNNFICDSAYDLDTDYLPDGDFDTVHHELIEAYTTDYNKRVSVGEYVAARTPNLIPSAADGSLIFSMYAPNTNVAVPAEGIWDLYGLTFEEFYTYGMNNDIVVTDDNITMPHRYADYNVTIQNANIKPTNHPTMLYPLLVNENKPIVGTIDYSDYQGDDLSYAMAYANKSEVDISIPNDVAMNTQYLYNIDTQSEYEYNDPRTIAKYTCNAKGVLPTFNSGYTAYKVAERDNGDGTYTTRIMADDINNLPTSINFKGIKQLQKVYYLNTSAVADMSFMFNGCSNLTSINADNLVHSGVTTLTYLFATCENLEAIDVSSWDTSNVTNMNRLFASCFKLSSIIGVDKWDISKVKDMGLAFSHIAIESLDVSNWDTSSVTNMNNMFQGCSSLTSLDLSNWKTSSVSNMNSMFSGCTKLITLDLTGWNLESLSTAQLLFAFDNNLETIRGFNDIQFGELTDFYAMFYNCAKITELDLTNMHTGSAANFYNIFNGCKALKTLDLTGWDTSSVATTSVMFAGASALETLKWTNWKPSVDLSSCPLSAECLRDLLNNLATVENKTLTLGATNLAKVSTADILAAQLKGWTIDGASNTAVVFATDTISENDTVTECGIQLTDANRNTRINEVLGAYTACTKLYLFDDGTVTSLANLFMHNSTYRDRVTAVEIMSGFFKNLTLTNHMFIYCRGLTSLDLRNFDVSSITNMDSMFYGCSSLTSLDVSNWDVSSVTTMSNMFYGCSSLTSLNVSNWKTSSVTKTNGMFQNCSKLTSLDVSNWDTSSVTNMGGVFQNCSKLTSLDVSNWDVSSVTNMVDMFRSCSSLTSIDLRDWDFSKVQNTSSMFQDASVLPESCIPVIKSNTLTNISYMFVGCYGFNEVDLSDWDIPNVTNVNSLFYYTKNVTSINLSGWDTSKVTAVSMMFFMCNALTTLDLSGWDLSSVSSGGGGGEFTNCGNLTQLYWTNWNHSIDISPSTKFTKDTLVNLINNLATVTDKTLRMGSTNLAKLTDSEKAIAINKGWTLA